MPIVERVLTEVVPNATASELPRTPAAAPCPAPPPRREPPKPAPARVYSKTRFVWIREQPDWASQWIGYLWFGDSVPLKTGAPVFARGCDVWYEVLPRGYVCVDDRRATLDPDDREYRNVRARAADFTVDSPHRYAESLGAPRYATLPDESIVHAREPDLREYLHLLDEVGRGTVDFPPLAGVDRTPAALPAPDFPVLPSDLQLKRWTWHKRSTIAHLGEFQHDARTYLLTSDLTWVPKDRTRPYAPVTFHGVRLDGSVRLPLAFFREHERPAYSRKSPGEFVKEGGFAFPRLGWVPLTGRAEDVEGTEFVETALRGLWIRKRDAVLPAPSPRTPWGSVVGEPDPSPPGGRATWVEASIYGGWLIAYEGTYPVYVTLSSSGRGGAPEPGRSPLETVSTPTGRYVVTGKFLAATMDSPDGVSHADVPWVQNFTGPYAIHSAYWHDAWGERVSGGCVNVSPADGRWLFEFSEPRLPEGWYGVRWAPEREAATAIVVHP